MTGITAGVAALIGVAFGWLGVLALVAVVALRLLAGLDRGSVAACAVVVLIAMAGAARANDGALRVDGAIQPTFAPGAAVVLNAPVSSSQRQYFYAELDDPTRDDDSPATTRVCINAERLPVVQLGDRIEFRGEAQSARDVSIAHRAAMASRGCTVSVFATSQRVRSSQSSFARMLADIRAELSATLRNAAPGDPGVLLAGLVTGDDAGFSQERETAFVRTGTTHLTAVSGSNLALVAGILATAGAATIGRHRGFWQAVTIGGLWGYALLTGGHPPSVRAAIVASAATLAIRFGRGADFPTLIMLAAGAMALVDPRQVEGLGFRLSVAASLALALVVPGLIARGRGSYLSMVIGAPVAAQIATLPFLLGTFGTLSLLSLPANVLAVPLAAVAMPIAAVAGIVGLFSPSWGEAIAAPAALAATLLIQIVDTLDQPQGYVTVGIPPLDSVALIAGGAILIVFLMSGEVGRLARQRREAIRSWRGSARP